MTGAMITSGQPVPVMTQLDAEAIIAVEAAMIRMVEPLKRQNKFTVEETTEERIERALRSRGVGSVTVAVYHGHKDSGLVRWARTYGVRSLADPVDTLKNDPFAPKDRVLPRSGDYIAGDPTSSTLFQGASVSKAAVAVAVLRLVQEQRLDLDTDITKYLTDDASTVPVWRLPCRLPVPVATTTLRQLLAHAAGINMPLVPATSRQDAINSKMTLPNTIAVLNGRECEPTVIDSLPAINSLYSDAGTTIVQLIIERVTNKPFDEAMDELVFAPLGMTNTTFKFYTNEPPKNGDYVCGHNREGETIPGGFSVFPMAAAGGIWTTAEDLCTMTAAVIRSMSGLPVALFDPVTKAKSDETTFLKQEIAQDIIVSRYAKGMYSAGIGFGLSGPSSKTVRFYHRGAIDGFRSIVEGFPESGDCWAMIMSGEDNLIPLIQQALATTYNWDVKEYHQSPHSHALSPPTAPLPIESCIGTFIATDPTIARKHPVAGMVVSLPKITITIAGPGPLADALAVQLPCLARPVIVRKSTRADKNQTLYLIQGQGISTNIEFGRDQATGRTVLILDDLVSFLKQ